MGKSRDAIANSQAIKESNELVDTFMKLSRDEKTHIGMAALYCYESMVPEIAENKIDGLKKYYNINDEKTLKFFTVHIHADKWHRQVISDLLSKLCNSDEKREEALSLTVSSSILSAITAPTLTVFLFITIVLPGAYSLRALLKSKVGLSIV